MALKLYGHAQCPCTKTVAVVLSEKNVPFEFISIDFAKGEHKAPDYVEKQPFGQVPYIDDDGFILYESRAISRYIEEKYPNQGTKLIPTDPKAKALFEQAVSIENNNFYLHVLTIVAERVFKKVHGQEANDALVKEKLDTLSTKIDAYDKILSKQKYLAGDDITLADLFHLSYGTMLPAAGVDLLSTKPNVARWFNEVTSRPSWQAVKGGVKGTA